MPFEHLTDAAAKLLAPNGKFAVIIPYKEKESFVALALKNKLHLNRACSVKGNENSPVKRSLLEFSFSEKTLQEEHLTIFHVYTEAYQNLVKDFYLKM